MADRKKLQAAIRATVEQIVEQGDGPALEQAARIVDLAAYLSAGDEPMDLYAELTGVQDADESFLRTIAAEKAENEGWDLDLLWAALAFVIRIAGSAMGQGATAEVIASIVENVTSGAESSHDNPNGLSAMALALA